MIATTTGSILALRNRLDVCDPSKERAGTRHRILYVMSDTTGPSPKEWIELRETYER
jgi:hypothetical protein